MAAATDEVRGFLEASGGEGSDKARLYSREPARAVKYHCNFDLYQSPVAKYRMAPDPPDADDLPDSCRYALCEYAEQVKNLGSTLFELLSKALGLKPSYLTEIECNQGPIIVCHYYRPCPSLNFPLGQAGNQTPASSPYFSKTKLAASGSSTKTGGLMSHQHPDLHDGFRSVEHRVVAKNIAPRVLIMCFFSTHFHPASTRMHGPIKELLSDANPPFYRETLVIDYIKHYYSIGLNAKTAISDFQL